MSAGSNYRVRPFKEADFHLLLSMVTAYYSEDQKIVFEASSLKSTVATFQKNPERGKIELLEVDDEIAGYSILSNFWSNEYGGTIAIIDEIFVAPKYRGKALATQYIENLKAHPPFSAVALQLEVTRTNSKAETLYERLGFSPHPNRHRIVSL